MASEQPAEVFPVGAFLQDEFEARGWTDADLDRVFGSHADPLRAVLAEQAPLTARLAERIAWELGTSAVVWLNIDMAYRNAAGLRRRR